MRIGFESTYCMNIYRRFLTKPLRKSLPDVYILGFPKCGTTAMASYLLKHPAVRGLDGLSWDPTLSKETHFFTGILGKGTTGSKSMYQSFFPTCVERWWCESVQGMKKMICMDACPLNACVPFVSDRIQEWTPEAKLIFMLRDPVDAAFSGEIMLRNAGMPLSWTLGEETEEIKHPSLEDGGEAEKYWARVASLKPSEPLPDDMPTKIYEDPNSVLYFSKFVERIQPFLEKFPRENIMFLSIKDLGDNEVEGTINKVLEFIGADVEQYTYDKVSMWSGERRGRQVDPSFREKLNYYFAPYNQKLFDLIGRDLGWCKSTSAAAV